MVRLLVYLFLALGLAFAVGAFVNGEPGYLMIRYRGQVLETSFVLAAAAAVLAFVVGYIAVRVLWFLLTAVPRYRRWRDGRRQALAERTLREGLMALAEGDWRRAENLLTQAGAAEDVPVLRYLGAAQAASAQKDPERRDRYLRLAHRAMPDDDAAVWLRQAELHLKDGHWEQARGTLEQLRARFPDNREAARLARELCEHTDDGLSLLALLPELKRLKLVDREEWARLEKVAGAGALGAVHTPEALATVWGQLSQDSRRDSEVLAAYARGLTRTGQIDAVEPLLRKRLKSSFQPELGAIYARLPVPVAKRRNVVEGWVGAHGDDPVALALGGDVAVEDGEHERARELYERSLEARAEPAVYRKLAAVLETLGEGTLALEAYRQGLALVTPNALTLTEPSGGDASGTVERD